MPNTLDLQGRLVLDVPASPPGWGSDTLTDFLDYGRVNCYGTFWNLRPQYEKVAEIDAVFSELVRGLQHPRNYFEAFFLIHSHSAFRAGAQLAMAGHLPPAHSSLRLCLENGLYAFHFFKKPDSRRTWLERHEDESALKRVKREFKPAGMIKLLAGTDQREAKAARTLYDRCIDLGAHPNERALSRSLRSEDKGETVEFHVTYLTDDRRLLADTLRTVAQVGACSLGIYRHIYSERFALTALSQRLDAVRRGL